jgi:predicted transcriptional regulator
LHFATISTGELADELGVTVYSMSRILGEMVKEGRLRRVGSRLEVTDPEIYMWVHPSG